MEAPVCPGIIVPEVVEQVIVIIVVVDLITNVVRTVAELLLTLGASITTTFRQVGTEVATIVDSHRLPISTIVDAVLPIVGGEVAILSAAVAQVRSSVGAVTDSISSIVCDGTLTRTIANSDLGRTCSVASLTSSISHSPFSAIGDLSCSVAGNSSRCAGHSGSHHLLGRSRRRPYFHQPAMNLPTVRPPPPGRAPCEGMFRKLFN